MRIFLDVCKALFGETFTLGNGDGYESWKTDRPMRKEGFNIGKSHFLLRGHQHYNVHTLFVKAYNSHILKLKFVLLNIVCVSVIYGFPLGCPLILHIFSGQSQLPRDGLSGELWPRWGGGGRQLGLRVQGHRLPGGETGREGVVDLKI